MRKGMGPVSAMALGIRLAHSIAFQFCCALEDLWDIV
jgi:hypothetical protein